MFLHTDQTSNVHTWTIRRPERHNALGTTLAAELVHACSKLESELSLWVQAAEPSDDPPLRALVIRAASVAAAGTKIWLAGGDLKELAELQTPADGAKYAQQMMEVCATLERLPVPVVMQINGAAIGGGAELALAGDIRIASAASSLDFRQLRVGLATGYGGAKRLVDLVGLGQAQRLLYTQA